MIGALVPRPILRPPPPPAVLPVLPARYVPAGPDGMLLDMARLDRSGRLSTLCVPKPRLCRSRGTRVFVQDASQSIASSDPEVCYLVRVGDRGGQWV